MENIPLRVKDFIRQHINAVWQLELLLIFRGTADVLKADDVSRLLYIDSSVLTPIIHRFASHGIFISYQDESFKFAPQNETLAEVINELASSYYQKKSAIINYIYDQSFDDDSTSNLIVKMQKNKDAPKNE